MTTTLGETDVDWLELIDFDTDIACEDVSGDCDLAVEWKVTSTCCGTSNLLCTLHKDTAVERVRVALNQVGGRLWCRNCKHNFATATRVEHIFNIIPM